jgi:predicted TIM-barrel fold metal-dependent hydrolase
MHTVSDQSLDEMTSRDIRLPVVSTDGHCGADPVGYRPYLEQRYHDDFDRWVASYSDPWTYLDAELEDYRMGVSSFSSSLNWDSPRRQKYLEEQGIVAEVLFPNTAPPFFPSGVIGATPPATPREYELRFAGLRAHNRWLADFCSEVPGRRAGIAQVFFNDVDAAIKEITWAHQNGLKGVLLPPDHILELSNLYYPRLDPVWSLCEELRLPLHRHGIVPAEVPSAEVGDAAPAIGLFEAGFLGQRPLTHLILSGVFDRHPELQLVMTEGGVAGFLPLVQQLDFFVQYMRAGATDAILGRRAIADLKLLPSEYVRRHVYFGTFFSAADISVREEVGVDRMMWGADFPHREGTSPYTDLALRLNFALLPEDEIRQMTSLTALSLYRFDEAAVRDAARRVGPTLERIREVVDPSEMPSGVLLVCPTFGDSFGRSNPE